ncbi:MULTISPECIES: LysR substrate-binding domain-containing protein [Paraburkholderia]|uniref:DNA-binding transcriptional regulator, LysR family n=1 Tax=Paraburkholderia aspalathi TaxID=1324617 RepID=A0A1I7ERG2_9BURK|nr:LysR substrate-binding domain-containing protein [Paraburkholderia aspalathi]SFU26518.1 DNA-binding transcriptional regulator, LysR family [Paraburkholderia aspalathi]
MDLKQLRYFVTVAEELSFSKAATRLHMSQPPLSQQIKALEEEMGVELFLRNSREVRLTHAGTVFLRESRILLEQFLTAVNSAVHASESNAGTLRVGVATSALFSVMPTFLEIMRTSFPDIDVLVNDIQSDEQARAVLQGALDIGIVHALPERIRVNRARVFTDHLTLVLPESHECVGKDDLTLSDLADEPMVTLARSHGPSIYDAAISACTRAGFSPLIKHSARSAFTIFQMVSMGFGFGLVPASYKSACYPGVVLRELPDDGQNLLRLELIWSDRLGADLARKVVAELAPKLAGALARSQSGKTV